jgi:hypothetical protein
MGSDPEGVPAAAKVKVNYWKLSGAVIFSWFFIAHALGDPTHTYANWNFIDSFDLLIHEAGHWIFLFFGEFMHILGGSLNQVLIPTIFAGYFFFRRQYYSASVVLFWVAQNILYVAVYMGDSIVQQLPLLGGDNVIHDWNWILSAMGLLRYTDVLSRITYDCGMALTFAAAALCFWFSFEKEKKAGYGH